MLLRQKNLPAQLLVKLIGKTANLMVKKIVLYTFLRVNTVVFSMLDKLLPTFVTDGTITRITVENVHVMKIVYDNIYMITMCLAVKILLLCSQ